MKVITLLIVWSSLDMKALLALCIGNPPITGYWPFVLGIHWWIPLTNTQAFSNAAMVSLLLAWISIWTSSPVAGQRYLITHLASPELTFNFLRWNQVDLREFLLTFCIRSCSIAWLLMLSRHKEPGHQQSCYWPVLYKYCPGHSNWLSMIWNLTYFNHLTLLVQRS